MSHPLFRSGDIVRMDTTTGPLVVRMLELDDPHWIEVKWDWPHPPEVQREIERMEER